MSTRIITGLLMATGAILLLALADPVWTWALAELAAVLVADEFTRITLGADRKRERLVAVVAVAGLPALVWWAPHLVPAAILALPPLLIACVLFSSATPQEMGPRAGLLVCGVLYLGLAVSALVGVLDARGPHFLLAIFAAVFGGDTGAFFAGKFLGKKKLYEKISPKKTWAGAFGGAAASAGMFFLFDAIAGLNIPAHHAIALGLGSGITGQIGDLAESLFKRAYGVKDSGSILPGHGGMWDRIDGILFAAPFCWIYLDLLGPF